MILDKPVITKDTKWSDIFEIYNANFDTIKDYLATGGSVNLSVKQQSVSIVTEDDSNYIIKPTITNVNDVVFLFIDGKFAIKNDNIVENWDYSDSAKEGYYLLNPDGSYTNSSFVYLILNNKENTPEVQDWIDSIQAIYDSAVTLKGDIDEKYLDLTGLYQSILRKLDELEGLVGSTYTAGEGLTLTNREFSIDDTVIQRKLTAGNNITIADNVISSTGGGADRGTLDNIIDLDLAGDNISWQAGGENAVLFRVEIGTDIDPVITGNIFRHYREITLTSEGIIDHISEIKTEVIGQVETHAHAMPSVEVEQGD